MNTRSLLPALLALLTAVLPLRAQTIITTTVDVGSGGDLGQYSSQAIINGHPAVAYFDASNGDLMYVRALDANGTTWGTPVTIDSTGSVGQYTSLAVVNGNPAISYYDAINTNLKYVRASDASGTAWGTPITIDSTGSVGQYTSLAVVNGNPAISYHDNTNGDLKYVRATTTSGTLVTDWGTPVTLDSAGIVGFYTSLAVVNGNPAISYYDVSNGDLKYVRATNAAGTDWAAGAIVDANVPAPVTGLHTSQAIVNGHPAIAYYDESNADLKYVRATNAAGTAWGAPVTVDGPGTVGTFPSLAVVNGQPAISYYFAGSVRLKYVRALDANGTTWGTPVFPDSAVFVGQYTSLAVVDGNPAISYYDSTNSNLKYVRATTASGTLVTDWGMPVTLDSTGLVGQYTSLAVVNGNPAISYYDVTNGDLKYVRATTTSGTLVTDWGTPVTLDSVGSVGLDTSLEVVDGNPAISYYDSTNGNLKYVRATTTSGTLVTDWGTPVTLDSAGSVGFSTSLAVVNGNPAISYYDVSNGNLKYVRATTTSGTLVTDWGTPVAFDSAGIVGQYTSLAVVNGNPAISYYDVTNGNLKWATVASSAIVVTQAAMLADGVGSVAFGTLAAGTSSAPLTFTLTNLGTLDLTGLAVTIDGAHAGHFSVSALSAPSVPVGPGNATFTVTFNASTPATTAYTAALHIASNDPDENPFDITLTGTGLSTTADGDGDGLNDWAEFELSPFGFDWQSNQTSLVNTLFAKIGTAQTNLNAAGYYAPSQQTALNAQGYFTTAQVQALHVGTPLLEKSGGTFKLTLRLKKSPTLSPPNFLPFAFTEVGTVINGQGEIEFEFTVPGNAAFFRLEAQ